jgi:hypothetical protein
MSVPGTLRHFAIPLLSGRSGQWAGFYDGVEGIDAALEGLSIGGAVKEAGSDTKCADLVAGRPKRI